MNNSRIKWQCLPSINIGSNKELDKQWPVNIFFLYIKLTQYCHFYTITLQYNTTCFGVDLELFDWLINYCNPNWSKLIWSCLTDWLTIVTRCRIKLTLIHVLLGFIEKRKDALNCIIIWTKQQLYFSRIQKSVPSFRTIKKYIKNSYTNERQVSIYLLTKLTNSIKNG